MSPLVSAPNRGYTDYQRETNWDTGILWNLNVANTVVTQNSGMQNVSRYAYLGGFLNCTLNSCLLQAQWWADSTFTTLLGSRVFTLNGIVTIIGQCRIPNLGPFVSLRVSAFGGTQFSASLQFFATNRVYPLEFIPQDSLLLSLQGAVMPAGLTNFYPAYYYDGPAQVWVDPAAAGTNLTLQRLNSSGVWDDVIQVEGLAANKSTPLTWVFPQGAWRMVTNNTSGADSTIFLTVTPTMTGAS